VHIRCTYLVYLSLMHLSCASIDALIWCIYQGSPSQIFIRRYFLELAIRDLYADFYESIDSLPPRSLSEIYISASEFLRPHLRPRCLSAPAIQTPSPRSPSKHQRYLSGLSLRNTYQSSLSETSARDLNQASELFDILIQYIHRSSLLRSPP